MTRPSGRADVGARGDAGGGACRVGRVDAPDAQRLGVGGDLAVDGRLARRGVREPRAVEVGGAGVVPLDPVDAARVRQVAEVLAEPRRDDADDGALVEEAPVTPARGHRAAADGDDEAPGQVEDDRQRCELSDVPFLVTLRLGRRGCRRGQRRADHAGGEGAAVVGVDEQERAAAARDRSSSRPAAATASRSVTRPMSLSDKASAATACRPSRSRAPSSERTAVCTVRDPCLSSSRWPGRRGASPSQQTTALMSWRRLGRVAPPRR